MSTSPDLSDIVKLKRAIEHDRDELWCQALIAVFKFGSPEQTKMLSYFNKHHAGVEPSGQRFEKAWPSLSERDAGTECEDCNGRGWFQTAKCCGKTKNGECLGECAEPMQMQCENCGGSGFVGAGDAAPPRDTEK